MARAMQDAPSSAMNFAMDADGQKKWSDVFAMAKALGDTSATAAHQGWSY